VGGLNTHCEARARLHHLELHANEAGVHTAKGARISLPERDQRRQNGILVPRALGRSNGGQSAARTEKKPRGIFDSHCSHKGQPIGVDKVRRLSTVPPPMQARR
jgi:hypothetical protein